jgi:hypothetical protein
MQRIQNHHQIFVFYVIHFKKDKTFYSFFL